MKRKLIYNYWLIIVSWCMFLNGYTWLSVLLVLLACFMLVAIKRRLNYWRMSFTSVLSYVLISFILSRTNIIYFFPKLYFFTAVICLDLALTLERTYLFKAKYLTPFVTIMAISISVLSLIVIFLPEELYSLFSKSSLITMIYVIFLPYLVMNAYVIGYKNIMKAVNSRKLERMLAIQSQRI